MLFPVYDDGYEGTTRQYVTRLLDYAGRPFADPLEYARDFVKLMQFKIGLKERFDEATTKEAQREIVSALSAADTEELIAAEELKNEALKAGSVCPLEQAASVKAAPPVKPTDESPIVVRIDHEETKTVVVNGATAATTVSQLRTLLSAQYHVNDVRITKGGKNLDEELSLGAQGVGGHLCPVDAIARMLGGMPSAKQKRKLKEKTDAENALLEQQRLAREAEEARRAAEEAAAQAAREQAERDRFAGMTNVEKMRVLRKDLKKRMEAAKFSPGKITLALLENWLKLDIERVGLYTSECRFDRHTPPQIPLDPKFSSRGLAWNLARNADGSVNCKEAAEVLLAALQRSSDLLCAMGKTKEDRVPATIFTNPMEGGRIEGDSEGADPQWEAPPCGFGAEPMVRQGGYEKLAMSAIALKEPTQQFRALMRSTLGDNRGMLPQGDVLYPPMAVCLPPRLGKSVLLAAIIVLHAMMDVPVMPRAASLRALTY